MEMAKAMSAAARERQREYERRPEVRERRRANQRLRTARLKARAAHAAEMARALEPLVEAAAAAYIEGAEGPLTEDTLEALGLAVAGGSAALRASIGWRA